MADEELAYWRLVQKTKFQEHPEVARFQQAMRYKLLYFPLAMTGVTFATLVIATSVITRKSTTRYLALFKQHANIIESKNMASLKDIDKEAYKFFKSWPNEKAKNPQAEIYNFIGEKVKFQNAFTILGASLAIYFQLYDLGIYNLRTDIYQLRQSGVDRELLEYEQTEYFHPLPEETVVPVLR